MSVRIALALSVLFAFPKHHAEPSTALLNVAFAGCANVGTGPTCYLEPDARITIWFPAPVDGELFVDADGRALGLSSNQAAGGRQVVVRPPAGAEQLRLRVASPDETSLWTLSLASIEAQSELDEAVALRSAGDLEGAEAILDGLSSEDPRVLARVASLRARLALSAGDADRAAALFRSALRQHDASGGISDVARDAVALAYALHQLSHDLEGADAALQSGARAAAIAPEYQTDIACEAGVLALDAASPGRALSHFEQAEMWARRLGMNDARWLASQMRSTVLTRLGRTDEADALLTELERELEGDDAHACVRGHLSGTRAWIAFLHSEAGRVDPESLVDALASARRAEEIFRSECRRANSAADSAGTVALLAATSGRIDEATHALMRARAAMARMPFDLESWIIDAEARVALLRGEREVAASTYARLRRRADDVMHREAAWRASWGEARATVDADQRIAALTRAEATLTSEINEVPIGTGRDTLASRRNRTAVALVDALLASGDVRGALHAARNARSRAIRAMEQSERIASLGPAQRSRWLAALGRYRRGRADIDALLEGRWSVAHEALPAFDARVRGRIETLRGALDDAYRALGPLPEATLEDPPSDTVLWLSQRQVDDWVLFAQRGDEVQFIRRSANPPRDDARLAEWAFGPFARLLDGARRVALLPSAELDRRDLHVLPHEGAPLAASFEVVYPLDIAPSEATAGHGTLLVSDPNLDLPGARAEHRALSDAVEDAVSLVGDEATRESVLAALATAAVFHFAGHGEAVGELGWDTRLRLAHGTILSPEDILANARVPGMVVLSGCDTGRTSRGADQVQALGIAPAFLVAGAHTVVATTRPVSDEAAAAFARHLVGHIRDGGSHRDGVRSALDDLANDHPDEWRSYRLMTTTLEGSNR